MTWATVRMEAETYETVETSFRIASTSSSESFELGPNPARARTRSCSRHHHEEVRPERAQLVFGLDARSLADPDDGDDAGDADDDPERGQEGAQLVARQGPEGDLEVLPVFVTEIGPSVSRLRTSGIASGRPDPPREPSAPLPPQAQPASDSSRIFSASSTSASLTTSGGEMRMTLP